MPVIFRLSLMVRTARAGRQEHVRACERVRMCAHTHACRTHARTHARTRTHTHTHTQAWTMSMATMLAILLVGSGRLWRPESGQAVA